MPKALFLAAAALAIQTGCGLAAPAAPSCETPTGLTAPGSAGALPAEKQMLKAQGILAIRLITAVLHAEKPMNVSLSPAALSAALGLAALGAADGTRAFYDRCLGFEGGQDGGGKVLDALREQEKEGQDSPLKSGVAILFDDKLALEPGAAPLLARHGVKPVVSDLDAPKAVEDINAWVKDVTRGAIPAMLEAPPGGAFVSLGALSFKDRWKTAFKLETETVSFLKSDGASVKVPMISRTDADELFRVDETFAAVDLAYADPRYRMVIIAKRSGKGVASQDLDGLASWLQGDGFAQARGDVVLPRFALEEARDLLPLMENMGLKSPAGSPDGFPKYAKGKVHLSRILQKTLLKLDENGTEAAAATAVVAERSIGADRIRVMADSRFAFALRDVKTGLILIAGLVGDPGAGKN